MELFDLRELGLKALVHPHEHVMSGEVVRRRGRRVDVVHRVAHREVPTRRKAL